MEKKRIIYISIGVVFLLIVTLSLYIICIAEPNTTFTVQINKISSADYKRIIDNAQVTSSDKDIDKFRHIHLQMKIANSFPIITHARIDKSISQNFLIQPYLKDNRKVQILSGGGFTRSDDTEYEENVEIFMKNTSEGELKNILRDLKVKVLWKNILKGSNNKNFYLKDYLK